jgi:hypothetical protein
MENERKPRIEFGSSESLKRPAWTQADLHAYRHKHTQRGIIENHYVKTKGLR